MMAVVLCNKFIRLNQMKYNIYLIIFSFLIVLIIAIIPSSYERFLNYFDKMIVPDNIPITEVSSSSDCQIVWSPWEACTVPCGGIGTQRRIGLITAESQVGGTPCPISDINSLVVETIPCNLGICPTDCIYSEWTDQTVCNTVCGMGEKLQKRTLIEGNPDGCKDTKQTVNCAGPALGPWLNKGPCIFPKDKVCGDCTQKQTRTLPNRECTATTERTITNNVPCPPCIYTPWVTSSECIINTNMCPLSNQKLEPIYQNGWEMQSRNVDSKTLPGAICNQPLTQSNTCQYPCPINCTFCNNWVTNNVCKIGDNTDVNDGKGYMLYTKPIVYPSQYGGTCDPLNSNYKMYLPCSNPFPQDCQYSDWSNVSQCTIACQYNHDGPNGTSIPSETNMGIQKQVRKIISYPTLGGMECTEALIQYKPCSDYVPCPVDCRYDDKSWKITGNCLPITGQCGPGWQQYSRYPTNYAKYGGKCDQIQTKSNICTVPC